MDSLRLVTFHPSGTGEVKQPFSCGFLCVSVVRSIGLECRLEKSYSFGENRVELHSTSKIMIFFLSYRYLNSAFLSWTGLQFPANVSILV
ncbi:hypothetical protein TNIN_409721 [Trichonephila inaurata madagascariensis]|uniref:Uncharacterized protein n=1 Tax=Trichonephila inaurata madagascariensis TaxID=2747483 RepID=A0A8X6IT97_9ARAC|nr:hypothetical protein TNIN_409721 [Trichonephila inaurata madagascariensis]